ncbi:hypothetical protein BS17DRAFT_765749 [Gyrodon lividus]|nr:hypothetical protein BS17DRAFT_765749 [Gyrodon lividus]
MCRRNLDLRLIVHCVVGFLVVPFIGFNLIIHGNIKFQRDEKEVERRKRQEEVQQEWENETKEHDRVAENRRGQEEEERQKFNMLQGNVGAHQCTTYDSKEYTALRINLSATWDTEWKHEKSPHSKAMAFPFRTCQRAAKIRQMMVSRT